MDSDEKIVLREGLTFAPAKPFVVAAEDVERLRHVVGGDAESSVPPSFVNIILSAVARLLADSGAVPSHGVVHVAEKVTLSRPIEVGEVLWTQLVVSSIRERAGAVQFTTESTIIPDGDQGGQPIASVTSTLVFNQKEHENG